MSVARKTSRIRAGLVSLLVLGLVFAPVDFSALRHLSFASGYESIREDTVWTSENGIISVPESLSVGAGATLSIEKGTIVEFEDYATLEVLGELHINGTPEDPVIFRRQDVESAFGYVVSARGSGKIVARNMRVSGGGREYYLSQYGMETDEPKSLIKKALAGYMFEGAFDAQGYGILDLEGVRFSGNTAAISSFSKRKGKVWRSSFEGNDWDLVAPASYTPTFDARYNWWGSADGPEICETACREDDFYIAPVSGNVDVSDRATEADFRDPVIVIPGIMGSWRWTSSSELVLSPILGIYDGLIETLEAGGYVDDEDLYPFPYEWRESNMVTAELLHAKIEAIKAERHWPRVDLVAHSMGGLVARQYVATHGAGSIDQLVTLGTPHNGSPKSYLTWEAGEFYGSFHRVFEWIFKQEAEKNGFDSVLDYVRMRPVESVRELLPIYSYLRNADTGEMRTYPEWYPRNTFLENLSNPGAIASLESVLFTNIVGRTEADRTIDEIRVGSPSIASVDEEYDGVVWEHGEPQSYDSEDVDGIKFGPGDKTVPLSSATNIEADETIEIESSHSSLPSEAAEKVYSVLTGRQLTEAPSLVPIPDSIFIALVFSPVDIQVVAPDGRRVGKDFETGGYVNEIDGAFYTGSDTDQEFVTIPNPGDGEYTILVEGVGDGPYRIEAAKIAEDEAGDTDESSVSFEGVAEDGSEEEILIEIAGETVELTDTDTTAPIASVSSPEDGKTYRNTGMLPLMYEISDDVFDAEDVSVEARLDDEATEDSEVDLALLPLGTHEYVVIATDEAGNERTAQVSFLLTTDADAVLENLEHYAKLGLLGNGYEHRFLQHMLSMVKRNTELIERIELSPFIRSSRKAKWIAFLESRNDSLFDMLIRFTERSRRIDAEAIDLLVDQLRLLRG